MFDVQQAQVPATAAMDPTCATFVQHNPDIPLQQKSSMTQPHVACCSVAKSKVEIRGMLDDFQVGLNRVLSSNLQQPLDIPHDSRSGDSDEQKQEIPAKKEEPTAELVIHTANCDLCGSRIMGDRYKCASCPDFDTCSSCFITTDIKHPKHSFIKITKCEHFIRRFVGQGAVHNATCKSCNKPICDTRFKCMHPDCLDFDLCQNCEAQPIAVHPINHPLLKMKTTDAILGAFHQPKINISQLLSSAFIDDVTIPDYQEFLPGEEFTKCWRLQNDGGCEWPESTELIFVAGYALSPTGLVGDGNPVSVGKIGAGETVDVETETLKAPEIPDTYVGHWRLRADGELFGTSVCVAINVTRKRQAVDQATQNRNKNRKGLT